MSGDSSTSTSASPSRAKRRKYDLTSPVSPLIEAAAAAAASIAQPADSLTPPSSSSSPSSYQPLPRNRQLFSTPKKSRQSTPQSTPRDSSGAPIPMLLSMMQPHHFLSASAAAAAAASTSTSALLTSNSSFTPLFSSATYVNRDPLATAASIISQPQQQPYVRFQLSSQSPSKHATSYTAVPGDETEDDEPNDEDDGMEEEYEEEIEEERDETVPAGATTASQSTTRRSTPPTTPFSFHPLNHRPWMRAFLRDQPIGTNSGDNSPGAFPSVAVQHAVASARFRRHCTAEYAYNPYVSSYLRDTAPSSASPSILPSASAPTSGSSLYQLLSHHLRVPIAALPTRMARTEWSFARRMIGGKTRRFSKAFLLRERAALRHATDLMKTNQIRKLKSMIIEPSNEKNATKKRKRDLDDDDDDYMTFILPFLQVGSTVFAPHFRGELAEAIILEPRLATLTTATADEGVHSTTPTAAPAAFSSTVTMNASSESVLSYLVHFIDQPRGSSSIVTVDSIILPPPSTVALDATTQQQQQQQQSSAPILQLELLRSYGVFNKPTSSTHTQPPTAAFLSTHQDLELVSRLLQLLDRKKLLLTQLTRHNEAATIWHSTVSPTLMNEVASVNNISHDDDTDASIDARTDMAIEIDLPYTNMNVNSVSHPPAPPLSDVTSDIVPAPAVPTTSSSFINPPISLTPLQFKVAYELFQRQYAWIVLQLESTSQAIESTLTHLRIRRASARHASLRNPSRDPASLESRYPRNNPSGSGSGSAYSSMHRAVHDETLSDLMIEAKKMVAREEREMKEVEPEVKVRERVEKEARIGSIVPRSSFSLSLCAISQPTPSGSHSIDTLIAQCMAILLLIERCVDGTRVPSASEFNLVLQSMRPHHGAHTRTYETLCQLTMTLQAHLAKAWRAKQD